MSTVRVACVACAALVLAACGIFKPIPHTTTYVVEPPLPAPAPAESRRPETLRMGHVRVAPAFAGSALVYRMDEVQFTSDFYNALIADPGPMLGARMAEWLDRSGPFKSVSQPGGAVPARFVLEAAVTELYGDFRPGRTAAAVMTVQFALVDLGAPPSSTVVLERFIGRRIDLAESSPSALVRGYGQALSEILTELSAQIAAANLQAYRRHRAVGRSAAAQESAPQSRKSG
jgi:cholesterol transport system auxiliary component